VERVLAESDWENARSRRVLARLGMRMGRVRHAWFKGRVATEVEYSIARAEWTGRGSER
jgi:RimJ/RimL family protein N-acetyltransferase